MQLSLINRKQFKGKYVDSILNGMKTAYSNLYPNNKVTIKYGKEKDGYSFDVYINGETFQKGDFPLTVDTLIYIDNFSNLAAIPLFSEIPKDEFIKEYLDYTNDNYQLVKDEWKKLREEYEPQGVIFSNMEIITTSYDIAFYHPEFSKKNEGFFRYNNDPRYAFDHCRNHGYFAVNPISSATAKKIIGWTRNNLKMLMNGDFIKDKE